MYMNLPHELTLLIKEKCIAKLPTRKIREYCFAENNTRLLNWLVDGKRADLRYILEDALVSSNLPIIKWAHEKDPKMDLLDLPANADGIDIWSETGALIL